MQKTEKIDKNILIRAKAGDLEAFECILSFYEKAIYNYCLRILKNSHNAKDVTQETFIKVYTHRKLIDPEKNIKTWIFTIAKNTTIDFLRKKKSINFSDLENKEEDALFSETIVDDKILPDEALHEWWAVERRRRPRSFPECAS